MQWLDKLQGKKSARPNKEEVGYAADLYFHPDRFNYDVMTFEYEGQDGNITITYRRNKPKA